MGGGAFRLAFRFPSLPAVRRGPVIPGWGWFALVLAIQVLHGVQLQQVVYAPGHGSRVETAVLWAAFTALGYGIAALGLPLSAWYLRRHAGRSPLLRDWGVFYGSFLVLGLIGGLVRVGLGRHYLPTLMPPQAWPWLALWVGWLTAAYAGTLEWFVGSRQTLARRVEARQQIATMLSRSRAEMVETDDAQRRELAELLHGRFQTHMAVAHALAMGASTTRQADATARAAELRRAAGILRALRTEALERLAREDMEPARTLPDALEELAARFQVLRPVDLRLDAGLRGVVLPAGLVEAAMSVASEALLNAYRHAGPCRLAMALERGAPGSLRLTIRDDGRGFTPNASPRGLGLEQMGAAFRELGGRWQVASAPGQGTAVTLDIPLEGA